MNVGDGTGDVNAERKCFHLRSCLKFLDTSPCRITDARIIQQAVINSNYIIVWMTRRAERETNPAVKYALS
jgi:hypothetical protein